MECECNLYDFKGNLVNVSVHKSSSSKGLNSHSKSFLPYLQVILGLHPVKNFDNFNAWNWLNPKLLTKVSIFKSTSLQPSTSLW